MSQHDARLEAGDAEGRHEALTALRTLLLERTYLMNLLATVRRETNAGEARRVMSKVVGIDLGTTNSLVAFVSGGTPAVIADESGDTLLPSIVSVDAARHDLRRPRGAAAAADGRARARSTRSSGSWAAASRT